MKELYYLGTFPPPFGGVTTKNLNLYTALRENTEIGKIDFSKIKSKNVVELLRLIAVFFNRNNIFAIGVAGQKTRKKFCKLLYYMNRKAMKRSIIFLMGGSVSHDIAADTEYQQYIAAYKAVYVETPGMKSELENVGLNNILIYPNCRFKPHNTEDEYKRSGKLSCVFFSLIQENKGVGNILAVAKELPNIDFAFYGHIDDDYKKHFANAVAELPNVKYMGVFSGDSDSVYSELAKYDVVLLPTKWKTEGIPGILVEAKIAGVTCIVSDESYNAEIIKNGEEGIVLSENTPEKLKEAIVKLDSDKDLLNRLKSNNHASAEKYYIENYIDQIEKSVRGGGNS